MLVQGRGTTLACSATSQPRVCPEAPLRPVKQRTGGFNQPPAMGHLSPGSGPAPEPAHPRNGMPGCGGREGRC